MRFQPNNLPSKRAFENVCYCATANSKQLQRAATFRECLFVPSPVGSFKPSGKAGGTGVKTTPVLQVRLCRDSLPLILEEGTETGRGGPKVH